MFTQEDFSDLVNVNISVVTVSGTTVYRGKVIVCSERVLTIQINDSTPKTRIALDKIVTFEVA
jgi:ribosome maturation factor RimP